MSADPGATGPDSGPGRGQEPNPGTGDPHGQSGADDSDRGAASFSDVKGQVGGRGLEQRNEEFRRASVDMRIARATGPIIVNGTSDSYGLSFGQGGRIRARRVTPEELAEPFLRTDAIQRLAADIGDHAIVVLQGPGGYGKATALLRALRQRTRGSAAAYFLDPASDLSGFICGDDVEEGSLLILADLPESAAGQLDDYTAKRIEGELRTRDCRLGITIGPGARLTVSGPGVLMLAMTERPDPRDVFWEHLAEPMEGIRVRRSDVLAWPGVTDLLDAQLGAACTLGDAQRLAMLLGRAAGSPLTAAASVRAQMAEYADEQAAQWFRKLPGLKAQCAAIALAVLNGMPREEIGEQARVLERMILPPPGAASVTAPDNPFAASAAITPAMLNARVVVETQMREEGPVVAHAMAYSEAGYPGTVLRHVWREYHDGRAALVDWLRVLGRSQRLRVRVRAATAVGVLACEALDYLYSAVIIPWARAKNADARDSAAIALGPPTDDPRLGSTIRQLVADWADPGRAWQLRATAARAYGQSIGLASPSAALRALARMAGESATDFDVTAAISNSYCELVLGGTTALSVRVIGEVERLARDRDRARQATGRLTMLGLATLRGAPSDMETGGRNLDTWPTLLLLALADERLAESAARLWQLALHDPDIGDSATGALDDWALVAEGNSELRARFVAFLRWIATDARSARTISRRAQIWSGRNGKAPKTGRSVFEGQQ